MSRTFSPDITRAAIWIAILIASLSPNTESRGADTATTSFRDKVSNLLSENVQITLAGGASGSSAETREIVQAIRRSVGKFIPPSFQCSDEELQVIAAVGWTINSLDAEYIAARCDLEALNVRTRLSYIRRFPALGIEQTNAVRSSLEATIKPIRDDALQQSAQVQGPLVSELDGMKKSLLNRVGRDPFVYFLRHPMPSADAEKARAEFAVWLETALAKARTPDEVKSACFSTVNKLKRFIQKSTSDNEIARLDLAKIDPDYERIRERFRLVENKRMNVAKALPATRDSK